eukprot:gi/632952185/ref/XP_007891716.1/ PREDICTED: BRICHOS domain-containing protein 5 [Callorhinchus milii]
MALRRGTPQVVLITFQDPQGHWVNQSARVDPEENVVTYSIKSLANHSAVVLFDGKNELVCYQPRGNICLVRQMTTNELENIQTFLTTMEHRVSTHVSDLTTIVSVLVLAPPMKLSNLIPVPALSPSCLCWCSLPQPIFLRS